MRVGSVFSGIGVMDYGLHLAGLDHAWFCESHRFRIDILNKRWPGVPVYEDIFQFKAAEAPPVDIIAGGFPPVGLSTLRSDVGGRHQGLPLWREMARAIRETRPRWFILETLTPILDRSNSVFFSEVLGQMAKIGYDMEWDCFPAAAFGAPHGRDRLFLTGFAEDVALLGLQPVVREFAEEPTEDDRPGTGVIQGKSVDWGKYDPAIQRWGDIMGRPAPQPLVLRMDDGFADRVVRSRLSGIGDGILVHASRYCAERILAYERKLTS